MKNKRICFFCKISDSKLLDSVEFYKTDIDSLRELDPHLRIATKFSHIDWNADILFIWWWTYAFFPALLFRMMGKKVYITGTFNYLIPNGKIDYYRRPLWQRFLIRGAVILATQNILVSKKEYDLMKRDWKYNNIVYSPHGIDVVKYHPSNKRRERFFLVIGWTNYDNIVRKSFLEIIDAIAILKSENINVELRIAGHKGDYHEKICDYIKSRNLESAITFLGTVSLEKKIELMQECLCYVQPSKYEGFGLAVGEAMACGSPIIASKEGELPNLIGDAGILINDISAKSISEALKAFINSDNISHYSDLSRERIVNNYTIEKRISSLKSIINSN